MVKKPEAAKPAPKADRQGNPVDENGKLKVEAVKAVSEMTDEDFTAPKRNVQLPQLPANVDAAIGADGRPVVIKRNIFARNHEKHGDLTPEQSREILNAALYSPDLYGQNQKAGKPHNWIVVSVADGSGKNRLVLLEVNRNKDNVEIVHWHHIRDAALASLKRQAEREGGHVLMLPSASAKEAGGLSSRPLGSTAQSIPQAGAERQGGAKAASATPAATRPDAKKAAAILQKFVAKDTPDQSLHRVHHDKSAGVAVATDGRFLIATKHGYDPNAEVDLDYPNWKLAIPDDKSLGAAATVNPDALAKTCATARRLAQTVKRARPIVRLDFGKGHALFDAGLMKTVAEAMAANGITSLRTASDAVGTSPVVAKNKDTTIVFMPMRGDGELAFAGRKKGGDLVVDGMTGRILSAPERSATEAQDRAELKTRKEGLAKLAPGGLEAKEAGRIIKKIEDRIAADDEIDALMAAPKPTDAEKATPAPAPKSVTLANATADAAKPAEPAKPAAPSREAAVKAARTLGMDSALSDAQLRAKMREWGRHAEDPRFKARLDAAEVLLADRAAKGKAELTDEDKAMQRILGGTRFKRGEEGREYEDVVRRYHNADGTAKPGWMKAPNGKPTKLTERQWVQVRTPSFKA